MSDTTYIFYEYMEFRSTYKKFVIVWEYISEGICSFGLLLVFISLLKQFTTLQHRNTQWGTISSSI